MLDQISHATKLVALGARQDSEDNKRKMKMMLKKGNSERDN